MPKTVISYDKDLPEIPDRQAHLPPTAYLRKKPGTTDQFEIVEERRPSRMLLVNRLRKAVEAWRKDGYPGVSPVAQRLLTYWFEDDHALNSSTFRFYFGQREAIETLVYLVEVQQLRDAKPLVDRFAEIFYPEGTQRQLLGTDIRHQTTMDGKRQIERYIPEVDGVTIQDLPEENLRRYAFKMATGSGKTVVMAMAAVWSYFHKRLVPGSDLSANFLILAPNVIVYQRLEKDFVRQLEAEGVGIKTTTTPPDPPVKVEPVLEKAAFDIAIPLTRPVYTHNYKRLSEFDPQNLAAIYDQDELEETHRIRLKMDFATTETEVHQEEIAAGPAPLAQDILASITNKTIAAARLPGGFSDLFSIVRNYVTHRCFGQPIDIDDEKIRDYLRAPLVQEGIAKYLARKIAELTAEKRAIEFEPRRCCQ